MSLKQAAREALKGNDVEVHAQLIALRKECRERGIDADKVTSIIRSVIHEDRQLKSKPKLESVPPPEAAGLTTEAKETGDELGVVQQDNRTDKELSRRAQFSGEPVKQRKDSDSMILMMADEKR